jgi:hypothetical protein
MKLRLSSSLSNHQSRIPLIRSAAFSPIMIVAAFVLARGNSGHDRGICDSQRVDPVHTELRVDDGVDVDAHLAGANWMVVSLRQTLYVPVDLVVRASGESRRQLLSPERSEWLGRDDPPREPKAFPQDADQCPRGSGAVVS